MDKHTFSFVASAALVASLGADILTFEPIVVSASKTLQTLKNTTADIEIITSEDIAEKRFATVVDALHSLPGISCTANGGLGSTQEVFIRGMDSNRILVLIDGIRYNDPANSSGANFAHLMIGDVERIEVIKGAQSGIWGADASAGVINIITKEAASGSHAGISIEAGGFNTRKWGGYVSHRSSLYDLKISADRIMTESFSTQTPYGADPDRYEDDPYSNTTLNVSAHWRPSPTDTLGVTHTDIRALSSYDGYHAPDSAQQSQIHTQLSGITYNKLFGAHSADIKTNLSSFKRDELNTASGVKIFDGKTKELEIKDRFGYRENDFLILGISKQWFDMDFVRSDGTEGSNRISAKAFYATNSNVFGDLVLSESLRKDDYTNFDAKTTGKIGAKYYFSENYYVNANYGTAYTAPNQIQIFNPWGASNADLKPENTRSYDIGVGSENWGLVYFENRVTDLIDWYDPTPANWSNNDPYYTNTKGKSIFRGWEASAHRNIGENIVLGANYTYLSKCENDSGEEIKRRPKEELKATLDYYAGEKLHLGFNADYVGTRYDADDRSGRQTGRYTLFGCVANYKVGENIEIYAKADNLTDKYYQIVDGYATPSRVWYAGLRASF